MRPTTRATSVAALSLVLLTLAACGEPPAPRPQPPAPEIGAADIERALGTETTLTFWSWVPNMEKTVALFERRYPKVKVNLINAGRSRAEYTRLQAALRTGTGIPDVAQIEYFALPRFAFSQAVSDLNMYGVERLKKRFSPSAWDQVDLNGSVYAVPQDTGPMTMIYRKDVFDRLGLKPPATWDEFVTVAERIRKKDLRVFITSVDPTDAGVADSLIWQAGGRPFAIENATTIRIDLQDKGARRWARLWTRLSREKLVDPAVNWTAPWWKKMASGRYALWITGAWAPGVIDGAIPRTRGAWRAAPLPSWDARKPVNAENGGSGVAVLSRSRHQLAAYGFARWLDSAPEAVRSLSAVSGVFPATTELMRSREFLDVKIPVLGGQRANRLFTEGSAQVAKGWQYLPFQLYANSVFGGSVGRSLSDATDLNAGLRAWQSRIGAYARRQGFQVSPER
ncbi:MULTISPECIES: ABC transporter substrate-binding protein [unclassified Streptosporangium]|uniref:ABC transporter substrate-binding protein n=1 Tax=unclassified Streptosporangium TaxID=2632669 RepID=UPI002E2B2AED|nr:MULTISPECIES: extracellular solute-binding protein [unclassified Streptosporangium]